MRVEILALAAIVGGCIWALRVLPLRLDISRLPQQGRMARFFAATGVAAIATLCAAGLLPYLLSGDFVAAGIGAVAVITGFFTTRSTVVATVFGSAVYGIAFTQLWV
jgi:hypothetical protein